MRLRGYLLVLAAAAQWGLIGPIAKVAFAAGMPPLTVAFWRTVLGWALFAALAFRRREARAHTADLPMLAAFGVAGIAGLFGSLALAVDAGGAALAAVLLYTAPAWVALLARLFFREPMGPGKLAAVALTMLGVAGVSFGQNGSGAAVIGAPAILFGLLSGLTYALYYIFGKHFLTRYTTTTIFLYAMPAGALVLAPFARFQAYPWQAWLAVGIMALVCTFGAYLAYYAGLRHLEATRAAVVATLEPVVAAVLAYAMWHESFGPLGYLGSALILAGVLLAMFEGERLTRTMLGLLGRLPRRADMKQLAQIKASAGSGKTYHLTSRFLELLRTASAESRGLSCRAGAGGIHAWPDILAITFTNKAAAEMKARVIGALKSRALELADSTPADAWQPRTAAMVLERILRRYHRLNIRTIDSLLHQLTTIFALELGINPDFELSFDVAELFEPLFDRFIAEAAADGPARELFLEAVRALVAQEGLKGFWLSEGVGKQLLAVFTALLGRPGEVSCDPAPLEAAAAAAYAGFRQATEGLVAALAETGLAMDKRFATFLENCLACAQPEPPPSSAYADKPSLADCVLARCKTLVSAAHEDLFRAFTAALGAYREASALARGAAQLAPAVAICQELIRRAPEHGAEAGLLLGLTMAPTVAGLLARGMAVPEAFCRLGARLSHLLIDEFQDTSREQWQALAPLAEECLAKGGSLYWVGDVKQAIYAWRGGDSTLFDAILDEPPVSLFAAGDVREHLDTNWRSSPAVVEFNNAVFSPLGEPGPAADMAATLLGKDYPAWAAEALAASIVQGFSGTRQEVSTAKRARSGYVRFEKLTGESAEDLVESTREAFLSLMTAELLPRRAPGKIAVLVRNHRDAGLVCDWLVEAGVPVVTDASLLLARHPLIRELLALLSLLDYPLDNLSLLTFATGRGLFLAESGLDEASVLDWFARRPTGAIYKDFAAAFPGPWERLVAPFFNQAGLMTPYDLIWEIVRTYRILDRHPGDELYVRRLLELAYLAEERGRLSLAAFLDFWKNEAGEEKVPLPEALGAVRIMTIHKAKGLEFPVVVVPFHHWGAREDAEPTPVRAGGRTLLVPRRKDIGRPYYAWKNQQLFEQLTMLYVAWTRAEDELYGFLPAGGLGRARPPILSAVAGLLEEAFGADNILTRGERPAPPAAPRLPAEAPPGRNLVLPEGEVAPAALMDWLPRLNIFRHSLADLDPGEKMRGEVAHRALELFIPGDDPTAAAVLAAHLALEDFPAFAPRAAGFVDWFAGAALWLLTDPRLAAALERGRREVSVFDAEGRLLRLDLLLETEGEILIVDYKTGRPNPENETQARTYLRLAGGLCAPGRKVGGLLVYLDQRELRELDLADCGERP